MTATATHKEMIMHEVDNIEAQNESFTAMVCEQAQLFGATPGPDEFDNRPVWGEAESTAAVLKAFHMSNLNSTVSRIFTFDGNHLTPETGRVSMRRRLRLSKPSATNRSTGARSGSAASARIIESAAFRR